MNQRKRDPLSTNLYPATPALEIIGTADITVGTPQDVGGAAGRRIVPITGGSVDGEHVNGTVLFGGGDWQSIRPDGCVQIDARYTIRTDDGSSIYVESVGVRRETQPAANPSDPSPYYFRLSVKFETDAAKYRWLTDHLAVGSAIKHAGGIRCAFYVVR